MKVRRGEEELVGAVAQNGEEGAERGEKGIWGQVCEPWIEFNVAEIHQ